MKREIKFRAWDTDNKRMLNSYTPDEDEQGKREYFPWGFAIGFSHYDYKSLEIMQYTGLKDKNGNGVEIYEGDIVEIWIDGEEGYNGFAKAIVVWETGSSSFRLKFIEGVDWIGSLEPFEEYMESLEVIGNIYENPELVEEQNL